MNPVREAALATAPRSWWDLKPGPQFFQRLWNRDLMQIFHAKFITQANGRRKKQILFVRMKSSERQTFSWMLKCINFTLLTVNAQICSAHVSRMRPNVSKSWKLCSARIYFRTWTSCIRKALVITLIGQILQCSDGAVSVHEKGCYLLNGIMPLAWPTGKCDMANIVSRYIRTPHSIKVFNSTARKQWSACVSDRFALGSVVSWLWGHNNHFPALAALIWLLQPSQTEVSPFNLCGMQL